MNIGKGVSFSGKFEINKPKLKEQCRMMNPAQASEVVDKLDKIKTFVANPQNVPEKKTLRILVQESLGGPQMRFMYEEKDFFGIKDLVAFLEKPLKEITDAIKTFVSKEEAFRPIDKKIDTL